PQGTHTAVTTTTTFSKGGSNAVDTLTAPITGFPSGGEFTKVLMNGIDTLIIDNHTFTSQPVSWERDAQPTGGHIDTFVAGTADVNSTPANFTTTGTTAGT